jgi:hypothetical protein
VDASAVPCTTDALRPGLRSSGRWLMARVTTFACGLRCPPRCVRPDVCRLHPRIAVLAVRDGVPRAAHFASSLLEPRQFAKHSSGIFDEPPRWLRLSDERHRLSHKMLRRDGTYMFRRIIWIPVAADRCDRERLARWRGRPLRTAQCRSSYIVSEGSLRGRIAPIFAPHPRQCSFDIATSARCC